MALFTKKFKGMCNICGKIGHKGRDCFTLEKNKKKKEEYLKRRGERNNKNHQTDQHKHITCYKCRGKGHIARNCPENKNPTALTGITEKEIGEEICLMANEKGFKPNLWIANSGATGHMVKSKEGLFNIKEKSRQSQLETERAST